MAEKITKARVSRKRSTPKSSLVDDAAFESPKLTASARIIKQLNEKLALSLTNGEAKPGDFLGTEKDIAEAFNISRIPVRDALQALQGMGMLDIRVGNSGGVFISHPKTERF
jgi:GntR family transcriptional repressor for pyruvate dehydrogenase complex